VYIEREREREGYAVWLRDNFMRKSCLNAIHLSLRKCADKFKSSKIYIYINTTDLSLDFLRRKLPKFCKHSPY